MILQTCRFCDSVLQHTVVDLGTAPLCNRLITADTFYDAEEIYPQHVRVCAKCQLVQLPHSIEPCDIFTPEYSYFSGYSQTWLEHCKNYVDEVVKRFKLTSSSTVMEIASNDGSLLQYFQEKKIPCVGIEPTENTGHVSREKGIPTIGVFFTEEIADLLLKGYGPKDLIIANNVLAHVPDINDFVRGMKLLLSPNGVITVEFPSVFNLIDNNLWDTIYHEHFSYLSLTTVVEIFKTHGLKVFDVDELPTHGGSLRVYACHAENTAREPSDNFERVLQSEQSKRYMGYYTGFADRVYRHKREILKWIHHIKSRNYSIAAYGAPGKGNTLLNFCGLRQDVIDFVVDENPHKIGKYLPGSRIPIFATSAIREFKPDYILILPWNWKYEILNKLQYIREWGGRCVVFMPKMEVL